MAVSNTAKGAELQIMIWFLESGWEVFMPVADLNGSDMVVRHPTSGALVSLQVKHKQPGSMNEGRLGNPWNSGNAPFDFLVFFQPSKSRGVILPRLSLKKEGKSLIFFKLDGNGYSTGMIRPLYSKFYFDFSEIDHGQRAKAFTNRLLEIYAASHSNPSASPA